MLDIWKIKMLNIRNAALFCATILPVNIAYAQTVLPEVVVTSDAPSSGGSLTVPNIKVQQQELNKTAGSVSFIDAETYKNKYTNNLKDVLQESPGVFVQNRYSQEIRLSIRGAGISRGFHTRGVEILQDGVPTNLADGSGDFYQIDPLSLRSVGVYKGANALSFGSTALGGAVNFVSPTGRTAVAQNSISVEGGSFGTGRVSAQIARQMGKWDFYISGSVTHADGRRQHERQQGEHFNANIGYQFSPNLETRFYFGVYYTDQKLPGTLTLLNALRNPRSASVGALSLNQARNTHVERIANKTTLSFENEKLDVDTWLIHKNLFHPIFQVIDQDGVTYGVAPRYTGSFDINGFRNDLVVGARVYGGNNKALQFLNIAGQRGVQTLNSRQNAYNYEAYAENRFFFLPQVALTTGVKAYRSERDYQDLGSVPASPVPSSTSKAYVGINPKIGLLWEIQKDVQAFANITRSADVTDFGDLNQIFGRTRNFVPLRSQRAWTTEIGTRGTYDWLSWNVTAYRSVLRDELLQFTTNPLVPASTFNAPRTVHQGLELGASVEVLRDLLGAGTGDKLTISQLWNYSDFRFQRDAQYGNNQLPVVPKHVLRTSVSYQHPNGFYVTPVVDFVPQGAYVDYANTVKTPSYALLGLQTGMEFKNGVKLFVDARNLTNKRYISDVGAVTKANATTATFYPGSGRSVFAGVRYSF
jgi:iron complex outermembrane recepter protein